MADPNITTPRQFRNSGAHTPAPWHTDGAYVWAKYQPHRDGIAKILLIDEMVEPGLYAECEANARLIAAAPELLSERDRLREINAELVEALERTALPP